MKIPFESIEIIIEALYLMKYNVGISSNAYNESSMISKIDTALYFIEEYRKKQWKKERKKNGIYNSE